MAEWQTLRT